MSLILKINDRFKNRKVDFFNNFNFTLKYDSVASVFGFGFYFDPNNIEHKELACVTHFHEVQLLFNNELLLTGVLTNQTFAQSSIKKLASFSGYSKPGVLEDCQIPTSLYPLQSDGLSLKEIAQKLIKPFKLDMVIDSGVVTKMNKVFKTSTASSTISIKDYLTELASQKDIIISHDNKGRLLFTSAKTDAKPILDFNLTADVPSGIDFAMEYDGQGIHSQVTVQKQADIDGGNSGQETIINPYVINSYFRPKVKSQSSGDDNQTGSAARREVGNELKAIKLTITMDRWDINGVLLKPNNTLTILAPELYLYEKTKWFIESINFKGDNLEQTAVLNCVLPEVYNKKKIVSIFRNINKHALDA